jgi:hypothetical protein
MIHIMRHNADSRQRHERRPPHRRQRTQLHHGDILGIILHLHDSSLLLHDALPSQRRAPCSGDWLGSINIRPCLGTECGDSVRHALLDWHVRVLLVHRDYICDRIVVQTSGNWSPGVSVLHSISSGYYVCGLLVCWLQKRNRVRSILIGIQTSGCLYESQRRSWSRWLEVCGNILSWSTRTPLTVICRWLFIVDAIITLPIALV